MEDLEFARRLSAAKNGDPDGVAALWRWLHPPLLRYLRVAASPVAEDLASETWLSLARNLARFHGGGDEFRAWAFVTARRRVLDWRRQQSRRPTTVPLSNDVDPCASSDPEGDVVAMAGRDRALALLANLPPQQRDAVALRVIGGLDVAEVARIMGKSPGAVRVLSHRGLAALARDLTPASMQEEV